MAPNIEVTISEIQPINIDVKTGGPIGPQGIQGETGPQGIQGETGEGVAVGGTTGQFLKKDSNTDFDTSWDTLTESDISDLQTYALQSSLTSHINDTANPHSVTKTQVGLGNVDNTSDLNKPISTATQTALNLKADDDEVVKLTGNQTVAGLKTFDADFTVNGDILIPPTVTNGTARNISWGTGFDSPALTLYDGGATQRYGWGLRSNEMQFFIPSGAGGGGSLIRHYSWNVGGDLQTIGTNEIMRLTSAGRLGIGTTSPDREFHIQGNASFVGTVIENESTGSTENLLRTDEGIAVWGLNGSAGGAVISGSPAGSLVFGNRTGADIIFSASNPNQHLRIKASGNVEVVSGNLSVGTQSPNARVHGISTTEQLRLGYNTSNYWNAITDSNGTTEFNAVGTQNRFVFNNQLNALNTQLGTQEFPADAGMVSWIDMPVSDTPSAGVEMSYVTQINGTTITKHYAEADGTGGIQNERYQVYTDMEFLDAVNGVILISPDDTRWRVTIDNTGSLVTTSL